MTFYEGLEVECVTCDGSGRITDEYSGTWEWCAACDGSGKVEAEPEDYDEELEE